MKIKQIQALLHHASVPEVSVKTGLSVRSLYRIKSGDTNITLATFNKLDAWAGKFLAAHPQFATAPKGRKKP